jgi:hypothetical protein
MRGISINRQEAARIDRARYEGKKTTELIVGAIAAGNAGEAF